MSIAGGSSSGLGLGADAPWNRPKPAASDLSEGPEAAAKKAERAKRFAATSGSTGAEGASAGPGWGAAGAMDGAPGGGSGSPAQGLRPEAFGAGRGRGRGRGRTQPPATAIPSWGAAVGAASGGGGGGDDDDAGMAEDYDQDETDAMAGDGGAAVQPRFGAVTNGGVAAAGRGPGPGPAAWRRSPSPLAASPSAIAAAAASGPGDRSVGVWTPPWAAGMNSRAVPQPIAGIMGEADAGGDGDDDVGGTVEEFVIGTCEEMCPVEVSGACQGLGRWLSDHDEWEGQAGDRGLVRRCASLR